MDQLCYSHFFNPCVHSNILKFGLGWPPKLNERYPKLVSCTVWSLLGAYWVQEVQCLPPPSHQRAPSYIHFTQLAPQSLVMENDLSA